MIETFMNTDVTILLWIQEHMRAEWLNPVFVALILSCLIAFLRLYLGVHYTSDVIAGAVSGILVSYLSEFILGTLFFQWSEKKE